MRVLREFWNVTSLIYSANYFRGSITRRWMPAGCLRPIPVTCSQQQAVVGAGEFSLPRTDGGSVLWGHVAQILQLGVQA